MKKLKNWIILAVIFLAFLYLFGLFVDYYGDWLWFRNMGYGSVFDTMLLAQIISFLLFFILFAVFASIHVRLAYRRGSLSR